MTITLDSGTDAILADPYRGKVMRLIRDGRKVKAVPFGPKGDDGLYDVVYYPHQFAPKEPMHTRVHPDELLESPYKQQTMDALVAEKDAAAGYDRTELRAAIGEATGEKAPVAPPIKASRAIQGARAAVAANEERLQATEKPATPTKPRQGTRTKPSSGKRNMAAALAADGPKGITDLMPGFSEPTVQVDVQALAAKAERAGVTRKAPAKKTATKAPSTGLPTFEENDPVEVKVGRGWAKATVVEIGTDSKEGMYLVMFLKNDKEGWKTASQIRKVEAE